MIIDNCKSFHSFGKACPFLSVAIYSLQLITREATFLRKKPTSQKIYVSGMRGSL